jgi:hypothetical protein
MMTWTELLFLFCLILLVGVFLFSLETRRRSRRIEEAMRRRGTKWEYREVDGKQIAIESDNPHQADVIAETWRTGKPVVGTLDDDGNFSMKVIGDDEA